MELLIANWPMCLCFLLGIGMLVLEAFLPGFGLPGVSGILLEAAAVFLCWNAMGPGAAVGMLLIAVALLAIAVSMSLRSAAKGRLSRSSLVLNQTESQENGYSANEDMSSFVGLTGEAVTPLRPTGMATFDSVKLNVVSDGEFIEKGTAVTIVSAEGSRILVRPAR